MIRYLSIFLLLASALANANLYQKVIHNTDPDAKCLDGSPGFVYLHEGGDTKNILIFFLGGGACGGQTLEETLQNCYTRSKDILGSSTQWPSEMP